MSNKNRPQSEDSKATALLMPTEGRHKPKIRESGLDSTEPSEVRSV